MILQRQQRPCISPYIDAGAASAPRSLPRMPSDYVEASDASMGAASDEGLSSDHVQIASAAIAPIGPADNSYQPYSAARAGSAIELRITVTVNYGDSALIILERQMRARLASRPVKHNGRRVVWQKVHCHRNPVPQTSPINRSLTMAG